MGEERKTLRIVILGIMIGLSCMACVKVKVDGRQGENTMPKKGIEQVLKENTEKLMSVPGVVGIAQGLCDQKSCIKVYVIKRTPEVDKKIPKNIEGFPVSIEETGEIRALPKS